MSIQLSWQHFASARSARAFLLARNHLHMLHVYALLLCRLVETM